MNQQKMSFQSEIFKKNSNMHQIQKEIDRLHEQLRVIDLEITEKVRMNQDKMIESAKIEMAINNLHRMVNETRRKPKESQAQQNEEKKLVLAENITKKLEEISDRMMELKHYYDKSNENRDKKAAPNR